MIDKARCSRALLPTGQTPPSNPGNWLGSPAPDVLRR